MELYVFLRTIFCHHQPCGCFNHHWRCDLNSVGIWWGHFNFSTDTVSDEDAITFSSEIRKHLISYVMVVTRARSSLVPVGVT